MWLVAIMEGKIKDDFFEYWDPLHLKWIYFMVQIKYYKSKGVFNATSIKILNDVALCTLSYPQNKILFVNELSPFKVK